MFVSSKEGFIKRADQIPVRLVVISFFDKSKQRLAKIHKRCNVGGYALISCPLHFAPSYNMASIKSVFRKDLFSGKIAIVTGGGTGIGKAITEELVELGCTVVIASRNLENLKATAKEINEKNETSTRTPSVYTYQCNIRKEDQVMSMCYIAYLDWLTG